MGSLFAVELKFSDNKGNIRQNNYFKQTLSNYNLIGTWILLFQFLVFILHI